MALKIRPIKVKQSVYFRVPNDIADLIGIERDSDVSLNLEETREEHLLVYRVKKPPALKETPILSLPRQAGNK
jgi:hypothetical protein